MKIHIFVICTKFQNLIFALNFAFLSAPNAVDELTVFAIFVRN